MDTTFDQSSSTSDTPDGFRTFGNRKYTPSENPKYVLPSGDDIEMDRLDYQHYIARFTKTPYRPGIRGHLLGLRVGSRWLERARRRTNENLFNELLGSVQTNGNAQVGTRRRRVHRSLCKGSSADGES
ncbi:hypothetical protein BC938DRAFT_483493 [Jimgerdemannia flammicorona]|uniref:Uncharacterized protein n=1 Tax=Jimgerdemannia flammicorona TaxID=994334 RepID=A0A433QBX8_9FUNG|nr:hypothetical protein BC938DRAFT_483493 [Jimgerdemannia flammicorona]